MTAHKSKIIARLKQYAKRNLKIPKLYYILPKIS